MHQLVFHSARALEAGKQNDRSFYSLPSPEVGVDVQQRIAGFFTLWQCLVTSKFQKFYKIRRYIKSLNVCIKH
jgi:hypothetical protein